VNEKVIVLLKAVLLIYAGKTELILGVKFSPFSCYNAACVVSCYVLCVC
jgi:hypothetical protein